MLARRREQIIVVLGLIGANVVLGWFLQRVWKDYRSRTQWLHVDHSARPAPPPATGISKPGPPQSFVEIVDRDVFSPLRGAKPTQAEEAEKAPPLPLLFGTMDLGNGRFALMALPSQGPLVSKRVLPGEDIGEWKLVSVNISTVEVEWRDTKTTLEISTTPRRSPGMPERTASMPVHQAPITTAGTAPPSGTANPLGGVASNSAAKMLPPDVPLGTIVGGKRKVLVPSPFGMKVGWEDVATPASAPSNQTPNK